MIRSLLALFLMMSVANAEDAVDPRLTPEVLEAFVAHEFDDDGFKLPYRLMSPKEVDPVEKRPLVLFLHGMGERGDENQMQLVNGGATFASPDFRQRYRSFVVAPQCPAGTIEGFPTPDPDDDPAIEAKRAWTDPLSPKQQRVLNLESNPTPQLAAAKRLVEHLIETLPVDADRVYVVGLSMGGYATWELATRDPDFWAAAAPICGGGDSNHAARFSQLPLWAFHGGEDGVVPVQRTQEMIHGLRAAGGKPIYTEFPGVGHDSWTPTFQNRLVWDWLFAQRR
jgi:predicted peptidase